MDTFTKLQPHIRWMLRRDMPEVLAIENSAPNPWTEDEFIRCLRQKNCIGRVATDDDQCNHVVGFMIYELHRTRLELLNIAVHPDYRRRGVGTALVGDLKRKLSTQKRNRLCCMVADFSLANHLFCKAIGFRATGIHEEWFDDGTDAYRFEFRYEAPAMV